MNSPLAATGTARLLETLSPLIPDSFINELLPSGKHPGRRNFLAPAQLWRTHLLAVLTPVHSFNGLVRLLPEQGSWRRSAHIHHRHRTPDVRMLHEFRARAGVAGLRRINEHLLQPLLKLAADNPYCVAIIDATDLPASTADKKKTVAIGQLNEPVWVPVRSKPATLDFLLGTKSIRCGYGSGLTRGRCSWFR